MKLWKKSGRHYAKFLKDAMEQDPPPKDIFYPVLFFFFLLLDNELCKVNDLCFLVH